MLVELSNKILVNSLLRAFTKNGSSLVPIFCDPTPAPVIFFIYYKPFKKILETYLMAQVQLLAPALVLFSVQSKYQKQFFKA